MLRAQPPYYRPSSDERRKARRIDAHLPCELRERRRVTHCATVEVSTSGALIRSEAPPFVGERRRFTLQLPDRWPPVNCECEVLGIRDLEDSSFAVRFVDLNARDWIRLASFLRENGDGRGLRGH